MESCGRLAIGLSASCTNLQDGRLAIGPQVPSQENRVSTRHKRLEAERRLVNRFLGHAADQRHPSDRSGGRLRSGDARQCSLDRCLDTGSPRYPRRSINCAALRMVFTPTWKAGYTGSAMDVERTIEFILDMQAKAEVRMAKADERMAKADERMIKNDERMDKFDKRLEATRRLVEAGMKFIVKSQKDWDRRMKELAEAQKKTDVKLDRLIDSWAKQRTNGYKK